MIAAIAASVTLTAAGMQYVQYRRYVAEGERVVTSLDRAEVQAGARAVVRKAEDERS